MCESPHKVLPYIIASGLTKKKKELLEPVTIIFIISWNVSAQINFLTDKSDQEIKS